MSHRKIPAVRGLLWCFEALRNVWSAPQPIFSMAMWLTLGNFLPGVNVAVMMLLTVFYGGMLITLHKKTLGERPLFGDFFQGFKSLREFLGLVLTGTPTVLFALLAMSMLVNAIGIDNINAIGNMGQTPDMDLLKKIAPAFLSTSLKLLPVGVLVSWIVFLAVPRVAFDKRLGLAALYDAVQALFSNLAALVLFSVGMAVGLVLMIIALTIPLALIASLGNLAAIVQPLILIFVSTLFYAVYLNAMYIAWQDIFMTGSTTPISETKDLPETQIEV